MTAAIEADIIAKKTEQVIACSKLTIDTLRWEICSKLTTNTP